MLYLYYLINFTAYFFYPNRFYIIKRWYVHLNKKINYNIFIINREIDREEFKKVMTLMRAQNRQGARHRDGRRLGLKVIEPVENGSLVEYFFDRDDKTYLKHDTFVQFLRDLHDEVCDYFCFHLSHTSSHPLIDFVNN